MKPFYRILLLSAMLANIAVGQSAATRAMIERARSYLGSESALNAMQSVHYTGTLVSTRSRGEESESTVADIEIIFAKDYRQRIEVNSPTNSEVTALDDYEGWQRQANPADLSQWRVSLLGAEQIKRLRANTWENLWFFGDIDRRGGEIRDFGVVDFEGRRLHKIAFAHSSAIVFYRYFNPTTGRLEVTETENGARITEEGETIVDGIRFPRKVTTINTFRDSTGLEEVRKVEVTFESVILNARHSSELFAVPSMTRM